MSTRACSILDDMNYNEGFKMNLVVRRANCNDANSILNFIRELAEFEKLSQQVCATSEKIEYTLKNENHIVHVFIAEYDQQPVGYALCFYNYSTFLGQKGLYLEDLYISSAHRGKGFGKKLFQEVIRFAYEQNCGRIDWCVLDWNKSAHTFYQAMRAKVIPDWQIWRLEQSDFKALI